MDNYVLVLSSGDTMEVKGEDIASIVYMVDGIDWSEVIAIFRNN